MVLVIIRHKVTNYDSWKTVFDGFSDTRKEGGETGFKLFRGTEDQNEVVGIFEWESMDKAKQFFEREDLKAKMQEAGVIDKPDIYFLD